MTTNGNHKRQRAVSGCLWYPGPRHLVPREDRDCNERDGNQRHENRRAAILTCQPYRCHHADWRYDQERYDKRKAQGDADALRRLFDNVQPLRVVSQDSRAIEFRGSVDELDGIVPLPPHIGLGGMRQVATRPFRSAVLRTLMVTVFRIGWAGFRHRPDLQC